MNIWIVLLMIFVYILVAAFVMGVICKYENAGHEIGLLGLFSPFWPTLILVAILYYPVKWSCNLGMKCFNFKEEAN